MRSTTNEPRAFVTLNLGHDSEHVAVGAGERIKPADRANTRHRVYNPINPTSIHVPRDFNPDTDYVVLGRGNKDGLVSPPEQVDLIDIMSSESDTLSIRLADGSQVKLRRTCTPDYRVRLDIEDKE